MALPPHGRDPALLALGELLHWLHAGPTACAEEREASAYWQLCRRQEKERARELSALRRAASKEGPSSCSLREDDATAPDLAVGRHGGALVEAVELLQERGLLSPAAAAKLRGLAPTCNQDAADGTLWGARLTAHALRASRAQTEGLAGLTDGSSPADATPAQLFAECLAAMLDVGLHTRSAPLRSTTGQYLLTADLYLPEHGAAAHATAAALGTRTGLAGTPRRSGRDDTLLSLTSVDLAGGTPRTWSLA